MIVSRSLLTSEVITAAQRFRPIRKKKKKRKINDKLKTKQTNGKQKEGRKVITGEKKNEVIILIKLKTIFCPQDRFK